MRNKIVGFLFVIELFTLPFSAVFAQTSDLSAPSLDPKVFLNDAQYCFIGKNDVTVSLAQQKGEFVPGSSYVISGEIKNKLDFPLSDGSLVVRVQKLSQTTASGYEFVNDVVDRFIALENIQVQSGLTEPFQFTWKVPRGIVSGVYRVEAFFLVGNTFALVGSESRGVPAASTLISVQGDTNQISYIDTNSVRVNTVPLSTVGSATTTTSANVSVDILNTYTKARNVVLEYRVYSSSVINENDLEYSGAQLISLKAGKKENAVFVVKQSGDAVQNVVIDLKDGEKDSITAFRTINPKGVVLQPVFAGLSTFPLEKSQPVKVFGCSFIDDTSMSIGLSLVDMDGNKLLDLGSVSGEQGAVSFSKDVTPTVAINGPLKLMMNIFDTKGKIHSYASVAYMCDNGCHQISAFPYRIFEGIMILLIGAIGLIIYDRRKKKSLIV